MPISRREFCAALGAASLSTAAAAQRTQAPPQPLRVIAYNVYACQGWPEDRPLARRAVAAKQLPVRLAQELALYQPDIVNFSESPSEQTCRQIADLLGMQHVRFPSGGSWPGTLLSRFPIRAAQNVPMPGPRPADLFTRHWGRAVVDLPNGDALTIHSAHLHPDRDPTIRLREVEAMLGVMRDELQSGGSLLLMGDLNHTPDSAEYRLWLEAGWVDSFTAAGQGEGFTIRADAPARRIDYVLAAGPLAARAVEARPLFAGAFRLHADDPEGFALSDHLPQWATFEIDG